MLHPAVYYCMKYKHVISTLLVVLLATPSFGAQSNVVPRGTTLKLILSDTLSSKENDRGDRFRATVAEDVVVNGRVLIRHGATVRGALTQVERAKRLAGLAGRAKLVLRYDTIQTVNGERPLAATLVSVHDPVPGLRDDDLKKDDKDTDISEEGEVSPETDVGEILTKGAIGVAAGALLGAMFGNVSRGVILGSIGGAIAILAPKGKDVVLKEGTGLQIRLDQDLNAATT